MPWFRRWGRRIRAALFRGTVKRDTATEGADGWRHIDGESITGFGLVPLDESDRRRTTHHHHHQHAAVGAQSTSSPPTTSEHPQVGLNLPALTVTQVPSRDSAPAPTNDVQWDITATSDHFLRHPTTSSLTPGASDNGMQTHPYRPASTSSQTSIPTSPYCISAGTHDSSQHLVPPTHTHLSPSNPAPSAPSQGVRSRIIPDSGQYAACTALTPRPPSREHGTSLFAHSSGFHIDQVNVQPLPPSKTVFEYLDPYISHGAAYNSDERCDAPKCSEETREAIQEEVVGLIKDGDVYEPSKRMIWLGGPAGAGKTAIAGSVAETCAKSGLLAGSFFFSSVQGSGDTRRTKRCVITTLAYQLAQQKALHEYKVQLVVAIEENPDIFHKSLLEQARRLILGPLDAIHGKCDRTCWPRGILYDGLDEVKAVRYHDSTREDLIRKDDDDQVEILEVLHALATSPKFPFRIFIASRPEDNIAYFFSTTAQASSIRLFLDSKYKPDADIKRFLESKFADLRHRSHISSPSWPGEEVVDQLVEMSSGQFIVPSTILRYIESGLPQEQLEDIMRVAQGQMGNKNPFALLDAVYTHIINRSPNPQLAVIWIRHMITGVGLYDKKLPAHFWKKFLEDTDGQFYHLLKNLASLLSVPPHNDHRSHIKIYHKSLADFLTLKDRCGDLYVGRKSSNEFTARRYVVILQNHGPKVPLPSPDKLPGFLNQLLSSMLFQGYGWSSEPACPFAVFLQHLHEPSISALAACDVAWWTRFSISTVGLQSLLEEMYRYIHSELCRRLRTGANDACLPACIHWREGILTEARALGWCVHGLEEVPLRQLYKITPKEFDLKFKEIDNDQKCAICHPSPNGQSGDRVKWFDRKATGAF